MSLNKEKLYPANQGEWRHLPRGSRPWTSMRWPWPGGEPMLMFRWTGEKRPPRKGEWFLSGATIEAYRATADLSSSYPIAEMVKVTARVVHDVEPT